MSIRVEVRYRGNVQGVGFRATTLSLSRGLPVHGSVRNMPDGSVQLIAEGEQGEVDALLDRVDQAMRHRIDDSDRQSLAPTGETNGFHIA